MGKPRLTPLVTTHFRCCNDHRFEGAPDRVDDEINWEWHPFRYFKKCPQCGEEAEQDGRYRGLLKAWANSTGPKTDAGKKNSAANLVGHPTATEALKTRFNAITHGLTAEVANYYPAKPGRYDRCETCDYFGNECIQNPPTTHKNPLACLSKVELFMKHRMSFDSGDAGLLSTMRSDMQAGLWAIINDMMLDITQKGVSIVTPQWKINPQTGAISVGSFADPKTGEKKTINEVRANPLLKILIDFVSKNNLSLEDMNMTPKAQTDNNLIAGYLDDESETREEAKDYRDRLEQQHALLLNLIGNSYSESDIIEGEVIDG